MNSRIPLDAGASRPAVGGETASDELVAKLSRAKSYMEKARSEMIEKDVNGWPNAVLYGIEVIDEAAALLARLDAAEPRVRVKALTFVDRGLGIRYADSPVGTYKINANGYWWRDDGPMEGRGDEPAAQADFERRIRSALEGGTHDPS